MKIDGAYYYLDPTWDDNSTTVQEVRNDHIDYDYFCITTEELLRTRKTDLCPVEMPICTAAAANYYQHNALIVSRYDPEKIKSLAIDAANSGEKSFAFKCATKDVYRKAIERLFGVDGDAFPAIRAAAKKNRKINPQRFTYSCNADLYTVSIRFDLK